MIRSKADCENAAKAQGLPDTDATEETEYNFPGGCYFYRRDKTLWYNKYFESEAGKSCKDKFACPEAKSCKRTNFACLCKLVTE